MLKITCDDCGREWGPDEGIDLHGPCPADDCPSHEDEDDSDRLCGHCNGSGEGMHDGSRCGWCSGSGVERDYDAEREAEYERADYEYDRMREERIFGR